MSCMPDSFYENKISIIFNSPADEWLNYKILKFRKPEFRQDLALRYVKVIGTVNT